MEDSWISRAHGAVIDLFADYSVEVTGQELRAQLEDKIGPIDNPHTFGPFIATLVRERLIERTGRFVPMQGREAHGRLTPVYLI